MSAPQGYGHVHVAGSGCCKGEASVKGVVEDIQATADKQKQAHLASGYASAQQAQEKAAHASQQIEAHKAALHQQVERGAQSQQDSIAKGLSGVQDRAMMESQQKAHEIEKQKHEAIKGVESEAQKSAERVAAVEESERQRLGHVAEQHLKGVQKGGEEEKGFFEKVKEAVGLGEKESTKPATGYGTATGTATGTGTGMGTGMGMGTGTGTAHETVQSRTTIEHEKPPHRSM